MNKINFGKIYNDFGEHLPHSADEFFNDPRNEVTRPMVQAHYTINSNYRSYQALVSDYTEYVAELRAHKAAREENEQLNETN
jgi:hypothetical protein